MIYPTDEEAIRAGSAVIDRFNAAMKRRGLGIRIEFKTPTDIRLRQLWHGAGQDALRILTGLDYERGPDGWCGPFLEGMALYVLNPDEDERSS